MQSINVQSLIAGAIVGSVLFAHASCVPGYPSMLSGQGSGVCLQWLCGRVDPMITDRHEFGQLHLDGERNKENVRVSHVRAPDGTQLELGVKPSGLIGVDPATGDTVLEGPAMIGSSIALDRVEDGVTREYVIYVAHYDLTEPRLSNERGHIPTYLLDHGRKDGRLHRLCGDPGVDPATAGVVVVHGERYDYHTHGIAPVIDPARWLNLTCRDHALATMKRLSYDPARPTADPYHTTSDQRVAALRMLTADYCGDGRSFTGPGVDVVAQNRATWIDEGPHARLLRTPAEAVWMPEGAVCVNTPRATERQAIDAACGRQIPPCPDVGGAKRLLNLAGGEWATWVRK